MRNKTYILDISKKMYQVARYKQFDNDIDYKIELVEDGVALDLDDHMVKAFFQTTEGIILQKDCTIEGNLVTTKLDNNILALPGKVLVEFTIYHKDKIVTTFTITLEVEKSINKNEAIQKEPVWDIIANLLEIDKTVKAKLEEVDNKLIETTEKTNDNTQKIDNKIKDIQNQLDSKVAEKFTEVDDTLNNKFNDKSIEINSNIDNKFAEKSNEIDHKVDNKILEIESAKESMVSNVSNKVKEADTKIVNCESRMKYIEDTFDSIVDGTGYAKQEYVDKSLEKKANKDEVYTIEEVDQAIKNIEIDTTPLQNQINKNKTDILGLQNELKISENTKYVTENGVREFECKSGYVDGIHIEGETFVNIVDIKSTAISSDRIYGNVFYYTEITTFINYSDKSILISVGDSQGVFKRAVEILPNSSNVIRLSDGEKISQTNFMFAGGWTSSDLEKAKVSLVGLVGEYTDKSISFIEGLKSVGQGDKIEVLTHNENSFIMFDKLEGYYEYQSGSFIPQVGTKSALAICLSNTKYLTDGMSSNITFWTADNKFISGIGEYNNTFTTPQNCRFVRGACYSTIKECYISKGNDIKKIPHRYDKKQILTTLRGIKDKDGNWTTRDVIEPFNNGYRKIERCVEVVLNGGLAGGYIGEIINGIAKILVPIKPIVKNGAVISDKLQCKQSAGGGWDIVNNTYSAMHNGKPYIAVIIESSKINNIYTDEEINKYFSNNPHTVVAPLETPIVTELPNFNPRTFENRTTLLLNSGEKQADAEFEVTNSLGSSLDVMVSTLNNLDNDYIINLELTMLNGWDYWDKTHMFTFNKYKNIVTLSVVVKPGVLTTGTIIAKLPKSAIPSKEITIPMIGYDRNTYVIFIGKNGTISIQSNGSAVSTSWFTIQTTYFVD